MCQTSLKGVLKGNYSLDFKETVMDSSILPCFVYGNQTWTFTETVKSKRESEVPESNGANRNGNGQAILQVVQIKHGPLKPPAGWDLQEKGMAQMESSGGGHCPKGVHTADYEVIEITIANVD
ncbi:unnamed protein product [Pieris macdunnoughi]|uniref:Uncharacterized protein n=1 Tax=Pieris macdunnoughi TaxID=345717 RepID=A0A821VHT3_9NEOP|nr:unnamed protein product [Pieris macdunnoughi]